jgi:hypothetical protein
MRWNLRLAAANRGSVEEVLIPEPGKVTRPVTDAEPKVSTGTSGLAVTPKRRDAGHFHPSKRRGA